MIIGIGVDSTEIARMTARLAEKILTLEEYQLYQQKQGIHQQQFLAGRFAVKEAYAKARGTGIGVVKFRDISVLSTRTGAPYIRLVSPIPGETYHVSITHDTVHATAFVIIEKRSERGDRDEISNPS
ncbi:MAG: holo-ACP synthase [Culicoidibacterales bacterium]